VLASVWCNLSFKAPASLSLNSTTANNLVAGKRLCFSNSPYAAVRRGR
jgi:hypothetical protein